MSQHSWIGRSIRARLSVGVITAYQEPVEGRVEGFFQVRWDNPGGRDPVSVISIYEDMSLIPGKDDLACANCRFYFPGDEECHRHAPAPTAGTTLHAVHWPEVREGDWCGEFEREP
jgi:hypothetical protein